MSGFGAIAHMNQMFKDNRNLLKKRSRLKENPFLPDGPKAEDRNPEPYSELMELRFRRRDYSRKISFWTSVLIVLTILFAILSYLFL